jgi:iron-sulfur cluster repair protein YtfE (RIC family)
MEMIIAEVASFTLTAEEPSTLGELLAAGKKVPPEATTLLMQDHAEVKAMFHQYGLETDEAAKAVLANKICLALTVHAQVEEEIFYPAAGEALEDDDLITEAVEEHGKMKDQIAKIVEGIAAGNAITRPLKALMQTVEHHVGEEETGMFPDIRQTEVDLYDLGGRLAARRVDALLALRRQAVEAEGQS